MLILLSTKALVILGNSQLKAGAVHFCPLLRRTCCATLWTLEIYSRDRCLPSVPQPPFFYFLFAFLHSANAWLIAFLHIAHSIH